jgi:hypothetical protein
VRAMFPVPMMLMLLMSVSPAQIAVVPPSATSSIPFT